MLGVDLLRQRRCLDRLEAEVLDHADDLRGGLVARDIWSDPSREA